MKRNKDKDTREGKNTLSRISRREFLKDAGLVVGGAAVGSMSILGACKSGEATVTNTSTVTKTSTVTSPGQTITTTVTAPPTTVVSEIIKTYPSSQGYLVVDSTHCAGCYSCMQACSLTHQGETSLSLSRIQIMQEVFATWPSDVKVAQCHQCVNPVCVEVCPSGACHVDTDHGNVRVIDETKCLGKDCMRCISACPYPPHRIVFNYAKNHSSKCDLCINTPYWDEEGGPGGKQACVEACPMKALKFVSEIPSQVDSSGYDMDLSSTAATPAPTTGGH